MNILFICVLGLLYLGASGVGTDVMSAFVMEGDSVTLDTGVESNQQDAIVWYFYDTRIAQFTGHPSKICTDVQCNEGTESFRDRLKLDQQTGSLTITNIRTTDSGDYKLVIISNSSSNSSISRIAVQGVPAAQRDEMKTKSIVEGESVTLISGVTENPNNWMVWYLNDTLIAEITRDQSNICTDVQCSDKFRDRLKLDHQTGSLTITNARTTDSGLYKLQISSSSSIRSRRHSIGVTKSFSVSVTAVPDSGLSSAALGGICAAAVVFVLLLIAGIVVTIKKGIRKQQSNQEDDVL